MKFAVDLNACENHGQCVYVAPDLFALDDGGELTYRVEAESEYVSAELDAPAAGKAREAADLCPVQAIRMIG